MLSLCWPHYSTGQTDSCSFGLALNILDLALGRWQERKCCDLSNTFFFTCSDHRQHSYIHTLSRYVHIAHTPSPSFRHHYTHADAHKQLAANYSLFNYFACCPLWWLPWPFPPERLLHSASASPPSWRLLAPMFQTRSQKAGPRNRPSERLRPIKSILPST